MEFEMEEPLDSGLWQWERREVIGVRQIDPEDMTQKALDIPESEEC